jgi:hypothetical protein
MNSCALEMVEEKEWPLSWPDLNLVFGPILPYITAIDVRSVLAATQVIIRFDNNYGVSIFRDDESDNMFYEMTPLKFYGERISEYENCYNRFPLDDLDWGYAKDDILEFCARISLL